MKKSYHACALLLAWHTLAQADSSLGSAAAETALESVAQEIESSVQDSSQDSNQDIESFITPQEYGANLYENPRGIGCIKCHGKDGEETLLASYVRKGKQRHIIVPRINNLAFDAFKIALSKDSGVMPKYNLTDEEINAIYLYITSRNKTFAK